MPLRHAFESLKILRQTEKYNSSVAYITDGDDDGIVMYTNVGSIHHIVHLCFL